MKKQLLTMATLAVFGSASMFGQQNFVKSNVKYTMQGASNGTQQNVVKCASPIPGDDWDTNFNHLVEQYIQQHTDANGRVTTIPATIPVVVHIIHNQNSVTQENISAAQVATQIAVLNADYAGTNTDITSIPSVFTGVAAGNTQIQFCLATVDPNGNTMAEPGIDRKKWNTISGATDPNTASSSAALQTLFDGTIKPNTIWDPTKYMNIWVAKMNGSGLLGYASWPAASTLTGLGTVETATTSGVVVNCYAFGTSGIAGTSGYGVYNKGRTATHEVGHWLGLRHISGDAACGNDFCGDTPLQKGGFGGGGGGLNFSCPSHPYVASGECSGTTAEMFMNYMDYVDDACMYMFTANQKTRMQTAMTNGTYRKDLGTHGLCSTTPTAPVAAFSIGSTGCAGNAVVVTNNTSGNPSPTYAWSASPATGVSFTSTTSSTPSITFANPGTYTVSVTATNTQGNSSANQTIVISNCAVTTCDTLQNVKVLNASDTSSITIYGVTGGGYLSGTNSNDFTNISEYYSQTGISGSSLTGMITLFYKSGVEGTQGTGNVAFQVYAANAGTNAPTTVLKTDNVTLTNIVANGVSPGAGLLYYFHTFSTPLTLAANNFHVGLLLPTAATDTVAVISGLFNVMPQVNTAWIKYNGNWSGAGPLFGGTNLGFCMYPIICPASVGLAASELNTQISVFPNPSSGIVNLAFALRNESDVKIEVTNMLGQVVYSSIDNKVSATTKSIDLSGVSKGVYMVTISTGTDKMVRKVVID